MTNIRKEAHCRACRDLKEIVIFVVLFDLISSGMWFLKDSNAITLLTVGVGLLLAIFSTYKYHQKLCLKLEKEIVDERRIERKLTIARSR